MVQGCGQGTIDEPLTSHDTAVILIAATTTGAGLTRLRRTVASISSEHEDPCGELKALVTLDTVRATGGLRGPSPSRSFQRSCISVVHFCWWKGRFGGRRAYDLMLGA